MGMLKKNAEKHFRFLNITGGTAPDGQKLALIVKDWVNGVSIPEIAIRYFKKGLRNHERIPIL
jgi:hypothetical protein